MLPVVTFSDRVEFGLFLFQVKASAGETRTERGYGAEVEPSVMQAIVTDGSNVKSC